MFIVKKKLLSVFFCVGIDGSMHLRSFSINVSL